MQTSLALIVQQYSFMNITSLQVNNFEFDSKNRSKDAFSQEYDIESQIEYNAINDKEFNRCEEVKL